MSNKNNSGGLEALLKIAIAPVDTLCGFISGKIGLRGGPGGGIRFATRWTGAGMVTGFMGGILLYWLSMGPLPTPPPPLEYLLEYLVRSPTIGAITPKHLPNKQGRQPTPTFGTFAPT